VIAAQKRKLVVSGSIVVTSWGYKIATIFRQTCLQISDMP